LDVFYSAFLYFHSNNSYDLAVSVDVGFLFRDLGYVGKILQLRGGLFDGDFCSVSGPGFPRVRE
jgi:hypothetical protein